METITIVAHAEHGYGFSTVALLALSVVVVGLIGWQVATRAGLFRGRG
jgi:hypothetical protein